MTPLQGDQVTRTQIRDYFGDFQRLIGQKRAVVTIVMEMHGHGVRPATGNDPGTTAGDWRRPITTSSGTGTPETASATNLEIRIPFLDWYQLLAPAEQWGGGRVRRWWTGTPCPRSGSVRNRQFVPC